MKLGLIRCLQTEDMCPATTDLKFSKAKKGAFEGISEDIELIGITTCGGCPGKKAVPRAAEMVERDITCFLGISISLSVEMEFFFEG